MEPVEAWVRAYGLQPHPEGGSFSESYTASDALAGGRSIAGSIYFLLRGEEISHLHQIDCEEVWFYHAGGGLIVTVIDPANGNVTRLPLGPDVGAGQRFMVVVPKGMLFASENLDKGSATLVSCVTAPHFDYAGFRLVGRAELARVCPARAEELSYLVLE
jgi:predicted cupin superfamily sugar epimerase